MKTQDIEGSKPKNFFTRTILTNPSLYSVSVTSLLDPENHALPKIYQALQEKQKVVGENQSRIYNQLSPVKFVRQSSLQQKAKLISKQKSIKFDSLQEAQNLFMNKKLSQPQLNPITGKNDILQRQNQPKRELPKEPSYLSRKEPSYLSRGSSTPSLLGNFHFQNSGQIKQKQSKGYNIITNLS